MIICKSDRELQLMRESGLLVAQTHQLMKEAIRPGVTTLELDQIAEDFIRASGATPSFKGYHGFPGSICTSINEELVHGIPGKRELQEGDIISIDIGVFYKGYHGDSAWTYPVGVISEDAAKLLQITEQSLYDGIKQLRQDERLHTVSHAIQQTVEAAGYAIVREYEGHGIGAKLHEEPQIPNYGQAGRGPRLKNGMVLAIEPMVNIGQREVHTLDDKWTVVTTDGSLCAHFEHTVAVVSGGYEILTITEV